MKKYMLIKMAPIAALGVLFLFNSKADGSSPGTASSSLTISYVECSRGLDKRAPFTVTIRDLHTMKLVGTRVFKAENSRLKRETIPLPPGTFQIYAGTNYCNEIAVVQTFAGSHQQLFLVGREGVRLSGPPISIAGKLPVQGFRVTIVLKKYRATDYRASPDGYFELPAITVGDFYYAGYLADGPATVRLYDASGRWIDAATVNLTTTGEGSHVIRNITLDDISNGNAGGM